MILDSNCVMHFLFLFQDAKRMSDMAKMLSLYQGLVHQLKVHESTKEDSAFTHKFEELGLYLRDLSHHVNYQVSAPGIDGGGGGRDSLFAFC